MKMIIHSKFGKLICDPMQLQAIEKSIPEFADEEANQVSEADLVEDESYSNELINRSETESPF